MYFAYFDESGDTGMDDTSPTGTFTLACLLIHDKHWLEALDQTVAFRRYLKDQFGISPRLELKASWLVNNKGPIRKLGLSFQARMAVFNAAMRFQRKVGFVKVFAVVVNKRQIQLRSTDVREVAWKYALQRLERFGTAQKDNVHVLPDEGHKDFIVKKIRAMRRFSRVPSAWGDGALDRKAENIVEDPSDRRSQDSFFTQFADLNAYAAFRRAFPGANFDTSVWDTLGDARLLEVNKVRGGLPGVVVWPPE
ncbi:DUF3800 domain-containing protein [Niveibacterium sp. 24ML]|uniref:DUF3800 domain-containing protein n=1 Tax=Niveibacterium sp. 24ML TaxID=2985512 RepID=UPI0022708E6A|nr:DUF3800 domain-containing protein [Niveibacterium sp. 24ML]MCX9155873.1 DUF3800 domain-containing protein [Niveibacterium sp. 24ML]